MFTSPTPLLPTCDFAEAADLPIAERVGHCIETIKQRHREGDYLELTTLPPVPDVGASKAELDALEQQLSVKLPEDYRYLLTICRYIEIAPGACINGLDYDGVYLCGPINRIDDLAIPGTYLSIGDYYRFADGDQLLLALDQADHPVVAYFHEHGPRIEYFAPSVSLALWRLVYEQL